jgi:diphosphomevalonate decarboxylase
MPPVFDDMSAIARARPNIALIKYWGKQDAVRNLPAVGSISITLDELFTEMQVNLDGGGDGDVLEVNGEKKDAMLPRVAACLDSVLGKARPSARVESRSNFPIAAGLASSASSFAALVVAAAAAGGLEKSQAELARLAGLASGSAARSLYDGLVELSVRDEAIAVETLVEPYDWPLRIVAAVTELSAKQVGSTEAMEISRGTSPFYGRWIEEQEVDLAAARDAIVARDFSMLGKVAEHNCLKMHSLMWTSRPPIVYWNPATLACLDAVRSLQHEGVAVFFTMDAGPQVKAVCLPDDETRVRETLAAIDGVQSVHSCGIGRGAELLVGA